MIGVFAALDAALFYVFWEAMLLPMFIIIGIWGGPRRVYATIKFFLYTFIGSLLMLVALIYMYLKSGTYELAAFQGMPLTLTEQTFIFLAFFAAFAVKVPMWPVHTWLPDAHVEAPTGGSVVSGGHHAQNGRIRFSAILAADRARCQPRARLADHRAVADRRGVHRVRRAGAARHEEADRLFVDRAHGLRHLGDVHRLSDRGAHRQDHGHRIGPRRRGGADALARLGVGRHVPVRRRHVRPRAQPRDQRLRRRGEYHAEIRRLHGAVRDGQLRRSRAHRDSSANSWSSWPRSRRTSGMRSWRARRWCWARRIRCGW